jgi:hypothetical protein
MANSVPMPWLRHKAVYVQVHVYVHDHDNVGVDVGVVVNVNVDGLQNRLRLFKDF